MTATTLEPDGKGLIYGLVLRLDYDDLTVIRVYRYSYGFNPTSIEEGTTMIKDFLAEEAPWVGFYNYDLYVDYPPFLIYFCPPIDFGITIILNLNTGKLMIAATSAWMGHGWLLYPPIKAEVNIDPDALKVKSIGQWITAYIELPEGHDTSDIDVSKILLDYTISIDPEAPTEVGDYDEDGIPDLMAKFDRAEATKYITDVLEIEYGNVTLTITGEVAGIPFEGSDTIKVLFPGDADNDGAVTSHDFSIFARCYGTSTENPSYDLRADFNEDGCISSEDLSILAGYYGKTAL